MCATVQLTVQWFEVALRALPNETPGGTVRATNQQLGDFHGSIIRFFSLFITRTGNLGHWIDDL